MNIMIFTFILLSEPNRLNIQNWVALLYLRLDLQKTLAFQDSSLANHLKAEIS